MSQGPAHEPETAHFQRASLGSDASYTVRVLEGPDSGLSLLVDGCESVLVGQSPACQLRLTDRHASRRHLALDLVRGEQSGLRLRDLDSTNGTRVNGALVIEARLLGGERVELGQTVLGVEPGAAAPIPVSSAKGFGKVLGESPEMRRVYPLCERLAASNVPCLIEGETGTGKEVLAEALHELGPRANKPFIVFDCTAVQSSLVESALFGHERGSFTGATDARRGVFELAQGGTLFIDELGDLELRLQSKLLRAIERGEVARVGSERWLRVDVRVIGATRRNLDLEIQEGRFRDDLFYRVAVARIALPPLRERTGDAELLARHFWPALGGQGPLPAQLRERLRHYSWPGNVRELRNAVARLAALGDLADEPSATASTGRDAFERLLNLDLPYSQARERALGEFEKRYVERAMSKHGGNVSKAAEASGLARRYFQILKAKQRD